MSVALPTRQLGMPSFAHLQVMTGSRGLYEHALYSRPRVDHGYSLDDNGRALVVMSRAMTIGLDVPSDIARRCLQFVLRAGGRDKWRDRQSRDGSWAVGATDDAIGRALWGLGTAAAYWPVDDDRSRARRLLERSPLRSRFWRPHAYAMLGLTALHRGERDPDLTERIRIHLAGLPRGRVSSSKWRWPDDELTYDNARLPEALMSAGEALGDDQLVQEGLDLLEWLIEVEFLDDHFSFTPVGGRREGDARPAFDQQPIEAWAMADAACRAASITDDPEWFVWAEMAVSWFFGNNDTGDVLYDVVSGAAYDGLTPDGPNLNRGTESTLSALGAILTTLKNGSCP